MTTAFEIKAASQPLTPGSRRRPKPEEIDLIRAFLVEALNQGIYKPGYQPDIVSVGLDAEDHGHACSEDTVDEAVCIAATLEGIPVVCLGPEPLSIHVPTSKERGVWKRLIADRAVELARSNTR